MTDYPLTWTRTAHDDSVGWMSVAMWNVTTEMSAEGSVYLIINCATALRGDLPRAHHHYRDEITLRGYDCDELLHAGILRGYSASNQFGGISCRKITLSPMLCST